mgnify:FL=1|tara:strand:- start:2980 stop:3423 length:444 start_codon:yes stop_codon:yes gene_type:complete
MHPARRQRLGVVLIVVFFSSLAIGLVMYAMRGNINLFYPPSEVVAGIAPQGKAIRVGGMVEDKSVLRSTDSLKVKFVITDFQASVNVIYDGILPDLFGEGQGVVVLGVLGSDGRLIATEVLAKHDENYMPPEIAESLKMSKKISAGY